MGAPRPRPVVLDSGALIALERGDGRVRALLELALERNVPIIIPVGVLAQVWRDGARQVRLGRFLHAPEIEFESMGPETARACGVLCGMAHTSDAIDASVVIAALRHRAVIVTSDPDDMRRLDATVAVESL